VQGEEYNFLIAFKVYMEVYNRNYERIFEPETASPDLNSMSYNPSFFFRRELRKEHFDPTCIALMTIITVDKSMNDNRIGTTFIVYQ
jgi:hypothetical protein